MPCLGSDGDQRVDCKDGCPTDPNKTGQGECGCGVLEGTCGLTGAYFNDEFFNERVLERIDDTVDFDWGDISPDSKIGSDTFSVRWTGSVKSQFTEAYTFSTIADDGVKLWIDNKQIINDWSTHPPQEHQGDISLTAGDLHTIKLEYFEGTGGASVKLFWSSPSQPKQIAPSSRLFTDYDLCPDDPGKTEPGVCGCGVPEGSCPNPNNKDFFSIGFLPDTQRLTFNDSDAEYFKDMMEFFVEKKDEINLVLVSALGDIVDCGWCVDHWIRAKAAYEVLENAGIPYVPVHGNHDAMRYDYSNNTLYNEYFPVDGYLSSYIGGYKDGAENSYYLFSGAGVDMILLALQFGATTEERQWGENILEQHRDRHAVVAMHGGGYKTLIRPHDNVFMAIHGHIRKNRAHGTQMSTEGTEQHMFQFDCTSTSPNTDSAVVRYYTFYPEHNQICMKTYSIAKQQYITSNNCSGDWETTECNEYCWSYDMN